MSCNGELLTIIKLLSFARINLKIRETITSKVSERKLNLMHRRRKFQLFISSDNILTESFTLLFVHFDKVSRRFVVGFLRLSPVNIRLSCFLLELSKRGYWIVRPPFEKTESCIIQQKSSLSFFFFPPGNFFEKNLHCSTEITLWRERRRIRNS